MGWKATGQPTVRKQRDKWVVRVDGIDTATGKHRPRQLGTYTSQRAALAAARVGEGRTAQHRTRHGELARAPLRRRPHRHHAQVAGELRVGDPAHRGRARRDPARLASTARTSPSGSSASPPAASSRGAACRSAAPSCALRSPKPSTKGSSRAARPPASRSPDRRQAGEGQGDRGVGRRRGDRFLEATREHRWAVGFRLGVLYGLRRSEVLALRWDDLDAEAKTLRIDESLVAVSTGAAWSDAKNERSRRPIPLDDETMRALKRRRAEQATERLLAGSRMGGPRPRSSRRGGPAGAPTLVRPSAGAGSTRPAYRDSHPRAPPHGGNAHGRQRQRPRRAPAIADILGHSPEMLMKTYAHACRRAPRQWSAASLSAHANELTFTPCVGL